MDQLKAWVSSHKALAIGGGIALAALLYLWLRSAGTATAPTASSSDQALSSYYAAQAAAAGDTAQSQQYQDELNASTAQTNAEQTVALAQVGAANAPYQAALDEATLSANLTAYQDYLAEQSGSGTSSPTSNATEYISPTGDTLIQTVSQVAAGDVSHMYDLNTGQTIAAGSALWPLATQGIAINWGGAGTTPTSPATTQTTKTIVQPGNFTGFATPPVLSQPAA